MSRETAPQTSATAGDQGPAPDPAPGSRSVELLTIGNELLLGETVDHNAAWLGRRLAEEGLRVTRRTTVADDASAIRDALSQALGRTSIVLCTGGLGPTQDDLTREVQEYDRKTVRKIPSFLAQFGFRIYRLQ